MYAKVSLVIFPLENKTNDPLVDWVGYSIPEMFFRSLSERTDVQVWDPVFVFSVDSSGWRLSNDSLLLIHQERWGWDYAIGGFYKANDDSVYLTLKLIHKQSNKMIVKKKRARWTYRSYNDQCIALLDQVKAHIKLSSKKTRKRRDRISFPSVISHYATFATGYGYEMKDDLTSAISAYKRVIEMTEDFAPVFYRIGMLYNRGRNIKEAQNYLDRALSKSTNSSLITAQQAEMLLKSGSTNRATSFIDSKMEILEKSVAGMRSIGLGYLQAGQYQRAVSVLMRAVAAGPSNLETDFLLGRAYLLVGQFTTSAEIFRRLIKYRPRYIRYYSFLGEAYREAGNLMESCRVLENALVFEPNNVPHLISLSNTYFKLGWYKKAERVLLKAQKIHPQLGEIYLNLGVLYWYAKQWDRAKRMFEKAADDQLIGQSALNNQGNILFLSGDIKKAIKIYKKADKQGKKSETILYNMALAYLALGKEKEAAACLDEVLFLAPNRIEILKKQAELMILLENDDKAMLYYRKILELSPGNREVLALLISLFEKNERFKEAMEIVDSYLNDFPQDREYRLKLPDIYRKMGWYEVAIEQYQTLMKDKDYKDDFDVHLGLGKSMFDIIRFKGGRNYDKTIYVLKNAQKMDPFSPEPDLYMGWIYKEYKQYRELAVEHLQKAFQKSKDSKVRELINSLLKGTNK